MKVFVHVVNNHYYKLSIIILCVCVCILKFLLNYIHEIINLICSSNLLNIVQLFITQYVYIEMRQMKEKEVEDLTSQLRDRNKQNETLRQTLKGNSTNKIH